MIGGAGSIQGSPTLGLPAGSLGGCVLKEGLERKGEGGFLEGGRLKVSVQSRKEEKPFTAATMEFTFDPKEL